MDLADNFPGVGTTNLIMVTSCSTHLRLVALTLTLATCQAHCRGQSVSLEVELRGHDHGTFALATVNRGEETTLDITSFDNKPRAIHLDCCIHPIYGGLSSGYVVLIDINVGKGTLISLDEITAGGQVVVVNNFGKTRARSKVRILASSVAVNNDATRFSFLGRPVDSLKSSRYGVYLADFDGINPTLILDVPEEERVDLNRPQPVIDWSPDGRSIVYSSEGGEIYLMDILTHSSRILTKGWGAHWSPSGSTVAYVSTRNELILLDVSNGSTHVILPGREILQQPPQWSPDGRYLLLGERKILLWPCVAFGRLLVYRLSDGETAEIPCFGIRNPYPAWIRLQ